MNVGNVIHHIGALNVSQAIIWGKIIKVVTQESAWLATLSGTVRNVVDKRGNACRAKTGTSF